MRRQNRIARRHFEPFVVSLQGREVLYEETFFWVIRLARVVTDDWGMEALAIPQLGVSPRDYHRPAPTTPWRFSAQWASKYLWGSKFR